MGRIIRKWLIRGIGVIIMIILVVMAFQKRNTPEIRSLSAKVEDIRKAVKLSTLDITTEEIFRDTINYKGVVSRVKARVYISFDIENMPMAEQGDTLIVQLPPEIIDIYESTDDGYQVLDVWILWYPEHFTDIPLTSAEENTIKARLKGRIREEMYKKGYVTQARSNAIHSLSSLFSSFKDHIIIIDHYPDGWKDQQVPPFFSEKPLIRPQ